MQNDFGLNSNIEEFKTMFLETNIYYLGLTFLVTILHSIF